MQLTKGQFFIIVGAFLVVALLVLVFLGVIPGLSSAGRVSGKLTVWGAFDDSQDFEPALAAYKAARPGVEVEYVKQNAATYKSDLLNALAAKNPPDVFMIQNTWVPQFADKIIPLPFSALKRSTILDIFPPVTTADFVRDDGTYALPLYIDTLALYYNQELFDQRGIALPPRTWADLEKLIPALRQLDSGGRVVRAAAAIGGSLKSINRAPDLLSLLMLQSGTEMTAQGNRANFASSEGLQALNFYTQFAQAQTPYFTWQDSFKNSIDAFADESAAMMFNYSYQAELLRDKNPFLKFRIVQMLQPQKATRDVNFANYWGFTVGSRSAAPSLAWDFVQFLTTSPEASKLYLDAAHHPPALRSLINTYINDSDLGVFARQALTARSWIEGDADAVDRVFSDMIEAVLAGRTPKNALEEAQTKTTAVLQKVIQ